MSREKSSKNVDEFVKQEEYLVNAFPEVDKAYLSRISHYSSENLADLVIKFSNMNSDAIQSYIKNLTDDDDESNRDKNDSDEDEIESDEDADLVELEKTFDEDCLVLGKTFLEIAHKKFKSTCGTEDLNISIMPIDITNMSWKPKDDLMLMLYRGFLEHIGILYSADKSDEITEEVQNSILSDEFPALNEMTCTRPNKRKSKMNEIDQMLRPGGKTGNDWELSMAIASLKRQHPSMSVSYITNVFKHNNMNFEATTKQLHVNPFFSFNESTSAVSKKSQASIQSYKTKLEACKMNKKHYLQRIGTCTNRNHTKEFYQDKLKQCNKMIEWYENAICETQLESSINEFGLDELDLHGFRRGLAKESVIKRLSKLQRVNENRDRKYKYLHVIYGRGNNSHNKIARLRPVIRGFLKRNNITYNVISEGSIKISLLQTMDLDAIEY